MGGGAYERGWPASRFLLRLGYSHNQTNILSSFFFDFFLVLNDDAVAVVCVACVLVVYVRVYVWSAIGYVQVVSDPVV